MDIDDDGDDIFNQILQDIDESRAEIPQSPIKEEEAIEVMETVQRTIEPIPYPLHIQSVDYEVLMPRSFWEKDIKGELEKYGLPPETQPTDFFNFLLLNRQKLTPSIIAPETVKIDKNKELQATAKLLESIIKLKNDKPKTNLKWWIVGGAMVLISILAATYKMWSSKIGGVPQTSSWIK